MKAVSRQPTPPKMPRAESPLQGSDPALALAPHPLRGPRQWQTLPGTQKKSTFLAALPLQAQHWRFKRKRGPRSKEHMVHLIFLCLKKGQESLSTEAWIWKPRFLSEASLAFRIKVSTASSSLNSLETSHTPTSALPLPQPDPSHLRLVLAGWYFFLSNSILTMHPLSFPKFFNGSSPPVR